MTHPPHNLPYSWTFWVIQTNREYEIEQIASFRTIEEFWTYYLQFPDILAMKNGGFAMFKENIKPAWEDTQNKGCIRIRINKISKAEFEYLLAALIGGTIDQCLSKGKVCGLYINAAIEIWFGKESKFDIPVLAEKLKIPQDCLYVVKSRK